MAVTRKENTIRMTAVNDEVTGEFRVQSITHVHTAAATASVGDSAGFVHAQTALTTTILCMKHDFPCPIKMNGIKATALSAGTLIIHIV